VRGKSGRKESAKRTATTTKNYGHGFKSNLPYL
jgi:hypothetical protein